MKQYNVGVTRTRWLSGHPVELASLKDRVRFSAESFRSVRLKEHYTRVLCVLGTRAPCPVAGATDEEEYNFPGPIFPAMQVFFDRHHLEGSSGGESVTGIL